MSKYKVKYNDTVIPYDQLFQSDEQKRKAFEHAMDIRKFEIELCWKRAVYFFSLLAALFLAYGSVITSDGEVDHFDIEILLFIISCLGAIVATGWHCVNRGSRYWQTNWECHVEALEDEIVGPLYKTTIVLNKNRRIYSHFYGEMPYSVSKINMRISFIIMLAWFALSARHFISIFEKNIPYDILYIISHIFSGNIFIVSVFSVTIYFMISMIFSTKSERYSDNDNYKFKCKN